MTDLAPEHGMDEEAETQEEDFSEYLEKFNTWDKNLSAHYGDWIEEAKTLYDFYAARQWTDDELEQFKGENRAPIVIDRFTAMIDAVAGAEITDRQQVRYYPREVGDSQVDELLSDGADWIRDRADVEYEESEAFKDALICGVGWTETRVDQEEDPDGQILVDRIDPTMILADPAARKPGFLDARYIRRRKVISHDEFEERFPGFSPISSDDDERRQVVADKRDRYGDDQGGDRPLSDDEVEVTEYQWFELETFGRVATPAGTIELTGEHLQAAKHLPGVVTQQRRRYYRAFRSGEQIMSKEELLPRRDAKAPPIAEFTYKAMTGKRDRSKGTWFGLGRLMKDPQKWSNSLWVSILHILRTNAKGGNVIEEGALSDKEQFEKDWAKGDTNVFVKAGALARGAIQPKPQAPYPQGLDRLMQVAMTGVRETTGVNEEMLGLAERQQAGVLEHQRKQAAYGILASFFDGLRRYRKVQGRLMLKMMQEYLPDGYLVRIAGADGQEKYEALARRPDTVKFDVIVDDAPAGPNQKERVFSMLEQLYPILKDAELGPEFWAEVFKYLPFPQALTTKITQVVAAKVQQGPDPMQQAAAAGEIGKTQADTRLKNAQASKAEIEAQTEAAGLVLAGM